MAISQALYHLLHCCRGLIRYKLVDRIQCSYLALSDPNFFYNTFNVICLLDKFHLFETKYLYILVNVYT